MPVQPQQPALLQLGTTPATHTIRRPVHTSSTCMTASCISKELPSCLSTLGKSDMQLSLSLSVHVSFRSSIIKVLHACSRHQQTLRRPWHPSRGRKTCSAKACCCPPASRLVPITCACFPCSPSPAPSSCNYTVKSGDTFYLIAQAWGTDVTTLLSINPGIEPTGLLAGQVWWRLIHGRCVLCDPLCVRCGMEVTQPSCAFT